MPAIIWLVKFTLHAWYVMTSWAAVPYGDELKPARGLRNMAVTVVLQCSRFRQPRSWFKNSFICPPPTLLLFFVCAARALKCSGRLRHRHFSAITAVDIILRVLDVVVVPKLLKARSTFTQSAFQKFRSAGAFRLVEFETR